MTTKGVCLDIPELIKAARLGHIKICSVCGKCTQPCYERSKPKYHYLGVPLVTCENAPEGITMAPPIDKSYLPHETIVQIAKDAEERTQEALKKELDRKQQ